MLSKFILLLGTLLLAPHLLAAELNLFTQHCASCHSEQTDGRIPTVLQLSRMNPLAILAAMQTGSMRLQAESMDEDQQRKLVEQLTHRTIADLEIPETAYCAASQAPISQDSKIQWSGWGGNSLGTGYVDQTLGRISKTNVAELELSWAFAHPGASQARSQPAIVDNTAFVGGADGAITALNALSGCIYWRVPASSMVRGSIVVTRLNKRLVVVAVASSTDTYVLDAVSGEIIWQARAGFHPYHSVTGTPAIHNQRIYVPISSIEVGVARRPSHECCVSSGGVVALDLKDGKRIWQMRSTLRPAVKVGESAGKAIFAPSGAPVWASPTVDAKRGLLYIGTGENYSRPATLTSDAILALDLETGNVKWKFQATADDAWHSGCDQMPDYAPCDAPGPDLDFGMSPMIVTNSDGKDMLVVGQKSAVVFALDPDAQGKVIWQRRVGKGSALGGIHWGMATDGMRVYVTNADRPAIIKDVNPGTKLAPGVYALNLLDGKVLWQMPTPGPSCEAGSERSVTEQVNALRNCLTSHSAAPTVVGDVLFAGDLYGKFRAYNAATGAILWTYDTFKEFDSANRVAASGGSIDGPGPVVANGRLYLNSGYGSFRQRPGNVLLSFELPKAEANSGSP